MADKDEHAPGAAELGERAEAYEQLPVRLYDLNAADAAAQIEALPELTDETLGELLTFETTHPKYEGGRKTVLSALKKRGGLTDGEPATEESAAAETALAGDPDPEPVIPFAPAGRMPEPGEVVTVRVGSGLVPATYIRAESVHRVKLLEGHPREVLVEAADLMPG